MLPLFWNLRYTPLCFTFPHEKLSLMQPSFSHLLLASSNSWGQEFFHSGHGLETPALAVKHFLALICLHAGLPFPQQSFWNTRYTGVPSDCFYAKSRLRSSPVFIISWSKTFALYIQEAEGSSHNPNLFIEGHYLQLWLGERPLQSSNITATCTTTNCLSIACGGIEISCGASLEATLVKLILFLT